VRYALPQPFEDLGHTADVGLRVRGASAGEALARLALAPGRATVLLAFGRWNESLHAEGADVKAVTWHAARLEPDGAGWRAQAILDV
jgi:SHS2 domain-containing protein